MQTLVLVVSRFQVSVVNRQYEKSRWSLVTAAVLLMIHYGLQMAFGFRAHSDDAGVIVNILFYTPVTFLVAHSILNLECEKRRRRRYDLLFGILLVATFVAFGSGWLRRDSLYMPYEQMVLHTLYLVSMLTSIVIPLSEIHRNRSRVEAETGGDIMPYVRYTWAGYLLFCCTTVNMVKLSQSIGVVRRVLSIYFDQHLHTTFRIWLSDIRFKEAQDYIKAHPEYTNESVSSACGFTSRSQLYKIFSDRTGMTPREWRDGQMA